MALTEARRKANEKYLAKNYKQVAIRWPIAFVDRLHAAVDASGESLAEYVKKACEQRMELEGCPEAQPEEVAQQDN